MVLSFLNPSRALCYCGQRGHWWCIVYVGWEWVFFVQSFFLSELWAAHSPHPWNPHSQWLHQRPDKIQTGRSPSPSAVVKWALDLFVQGGGAPWAVMGHNSGPVSRNKWLTTDFIFLSFFFRIIEIFTNKIAINHCECPMYLLQTCPFIVQTCWPSSAMVTFESFLENE